MSWDSFQYGDPYNTFYLFQRQKYHMKIEIQVMFSYVYARTSVLIKSWHVDEKKVICIRVKIL